MSEADLWRYHAYAYGFRRVVINNFDRQYPRDELGEWFNHDMAAKAERWYRAKLGKPERRRFAPPLGQDTIRPNCNEIPATELTDAEREYFKPHIDQLAAEAGANLAAIVARGK